MVFADFLPAGKRRCRSSAGRKPPMRNPWGQARGLCEPGPRRPRSWMSLRGAARTDVGLRRRANEDTFALVPELGLYLVADGMGGHTAGQVASELAAEAAVRAVRTLEGASASLTDKLRYACAAANREILAAAKAKP